MLGSIITVSLLAIRKQTRKSCYHKKPHDAAGFSHAKWLFDFVICFSLRKVKAAIPSSHLST